MMNSAWFIPYLALSIAIWCTTANAIALESNFPTLVDTLKAFPGVVATYHDESPREPARLSISIDASSELQLVAVFKICSSSHEELHVGIKNSALNRDTMTELSNCVNLSYLSLNGCSIEVGDSLGRCAKLTTLHIGQSDLSATEIKLLADAFPHVLTLSLTASNLSDLEVLSIREFSRLESLDLSQNSSVTDESLVKLTSHKRLKRIRLRNCGVTGAALGKTNEHTQLIELDLSKTSIRRFLNRALEKDAHSPTDSILSKLMKNQDDEQRIMLKGLSRMGRLKTLNLSGRCFPPEDMDELTKLPELSELNLSESNVDDSHLRKLVSSTSLKTIILSGTEISNDGLQMLGNMNSIGKVEMIETDIDVIDAEVFRNKWPRIRLVTEPPEILAPEW